MVPATVNGDSLQEAVVGNGPQNDLSSFENHRNICGKKPELIDGALGTKANLALETKTSPQLCRSLSLSFHPLFPCAPAGLVLSNLFHVHTAHWSRWNKIEQTYT